MKESSFITITTTAIHITMIHGTTIPGMGVIPPVGDFISDFQITGGILSGIPGVAGDRVAIQ